METGSAPSILLKSLTDRPVPMGAAVGTFRRRARKRRKHDGRHRRGGKAERVRIGDIWYTGLSPDWLAGGATRGEAG